MEFIDAPQTGVVQIRNVGPGGDISAGRTVTPMPP